MALKPTIFKFKIALSDLNTHHYDSYELTLALHPSETMERMMVRVLAFCLNASPELLFTKGLSDTTEPDIWRHSLDGNLESWIEVGEPSEDRIKKSSRLCPDVKVYSFNTKSSTWWDNEKAKIGVLDVFIYRFVWAEIQCLSSFVERTMEFSVTIEDACLYVATAQGECEIHLETLQAVV